MAESSSSGLTTVTKPKVLMLDYNFNTYASYGTYKGWGVSPCHKCADGSMPVLTNDFDGMGVWKCGMNGKGATELAAPYRYCEVIEAAGGEVYNQHVLANPAVQASTSAGPANNDVTPWPVGPWPGGGSNVGGLSGYNNAQLELVAKDVDIIILKTGNCGCSWSTKPCTAEECVQKYDDVFKGLTGIKAVANKKVFDFYGTVDPHGGTAFYSDFSVDVFLKDFIKAVSGDTSQATKQHDFYYLRDNFAVNSWGDLYECGDPGAPAKGCRPTKTSLVAKCTDPLMMDSITADQCAAYVPPVVDVAAQAQENIKQEKAGTAASSGSFLTPTFGLLLAPVMVAFTLKSGAGY